MDSDRRFWVEIGPGELIDRLTILRLKRERISAPAAPLAAQIAALEGQVSGLFDLPELAALTDELAAINARLWDAEDAVRSFERAGDFGEAFIAQARSIYRDNDRRAQTKARIDLLISGSVHEVKTHARAQVDRET